MIKLYNEIYPLAKAIDFNDINLERAQYNNNIITFFYQLILFIFKTTMVDKTADDKTLIIAYSTITFCFNEILLKQSLALRNKYMELTTQFQNNNAMNDRIQKKIADMNNQMPTDASSQLTSQVSEVSEVSGVSENTGSETETITETVTETKATTEETQPKQSGGQKNNVNAKYDILDSIDFNSDNGYKEVDDKTNNTNHSFNSKSAVNNAHILTI